MQHTPSCRAISTHINPSLLGGSGLIFIDIALHLRVYCVHITLLADANFVCLGTVRHDSALPDTVECEKHGVDMYSTWHVHAHVHVHVHAHVREK